MNPSAESFVSGFPAAAPCQTRTSQVLQSPFEIFRGEILHNPFALLLLGGALIAAHLFVVIFQPVKADAYIYVLVAVACTVETAVLVLHARSNRGHLQLRWGLLAAGFVVYVFTYLRASLTELTGVDYATANLVAQVLSSSCFVLALTLPSEEQSRGERVLDLSIVVAFWVVRFLFLQIVIPPGSPHNIERMTLEAGVRVLLAFLGLMAASSADRNFFRAAAVIMSAMFVSMILENEVGYVLLPQLTSEPFSITDTVERVGCSVYLFYALSRRQLSAKVRPYRVALGSVVPFTMSALIVFLSVSLLPTHACIGYCGLTFGVGVILLRVGFMSRRPPSIVIEEDLMREIASEIIKDPLYGLADRHGLEPALAYARSSVNGQSPLALILFAIDVADHGIDIVADDADSRSLVSIARTLNHWHTPDSTICYLGQGRFAMLLPATPLRIAMSLAEQICLSIDSLNLSDEDGPVAVIAGVAACAEPSRVSGLIHTSSLALERAQVHRESRVRTTPLRGEAIFDA